MYAYRDKVSSKVTSSAPAKPIKTRLGFSKGNKADKKQQELVI